MQTVLRNNPDPTLWSIREQIYRYCEKKVFFFSIAETFQIVCSTLVSETQGCLWKLLWRLERRPVSQSLNSNPAESDRRERPKGSLVQLLRCTIKLYQSFYWHSFHCLLLDLFHLTKLLFPGRSWASAACCIEWHYGITGFWASAVNCKWLVVFAFNSSR